MTFQHSLTDGRENKLAVSMSTIIDQQDTVQAVDLSSVIGKVLRFSVLAWQGVKYNGIVCTIILN